MQRRRVKAQRVEPLKSRSDVDKLREHLRKEYHHGETYALAVTLGCNFGLRAGDLLSLQARHIQNTDEFEMIEEKTGKARKIYINQKAKTEIKKYLKNYIFIAQDYFIFEGQKRSKNGLYRLEVKALHKIIKHSCRELGFKGNYGTHTLRKTFAYFAFASTTLETMKDLLHHGNINTTRLYTHNAEIQTEDKFKEIREIYMSLNI